MILVILATLALNLLGDRGYPSTAAFPLLPSPSERLVAPSHLLDLPFSMLPGPSGALLVSDAARDQILALGPQARITRRSGAFGQGPGELN